MNKTGTSTIATFGQTTISVGFIECFLYQITPPAHDGAEGNVRRLLTKNPARSFSCPSCQTRGHSSHTTHVPLVRHSLWLVLCVTEMTL